MCRCIPFSGVSASASLMAPASAMRASLALTALAMTFPAVGTSASAIKTTSFPESGFAPSINLAISYSFKNRRSGYPLGLNTKVFVITYSVGSSVLTVSSCAFHSTVFFAGPWLTNGVPPGTNFSICSLVLAIFAVVIGTSIE